MRDLTRGGLAAALNEIAAVCGASMLLDENKIPVLPQVKAVCDALGLDALNFANEGKLVVFVKPDVKDKVLAAMRKNPLGENAEIIGEVITSEWQPEVIINNENGGKRLLEWAYGDYLPRIC